jgi:hypothetical protein
VTADHIAYRIERYLAQAWSRQEAHTLAHTLDKDGIPVYWGDVEKMLRRADHALVLEDILLGAFRPNYVMDFSEPGPLGSVDDGA